MFNKKKIDAVAEDLSDLSLCCDREHISLRDNDEKISFKYRTLLASIEELQERIKKIEDSLIVAVPEETKPERNIKMQNKDGLYSWKRYREFVAGTKKEEEE